MQTAAQDTEWIDRTEYPFESRYLPVEGGRMHYVDEGQGQPILMVHGTPSWSFLYRNLVKDLSRNYRCIAPDHIGFGLSDKPSEWSYRPEDHARNLQKLIEHLGLRDVILVVHDFGGPIGLSYAIEHPENISALVLFNTWMWSLEDDPATRRASKIASSGLGKLLYTRANFSPRVLLKALYGDKSKLTREIHRHYTRAFPDASQRQGPWTLARELVGSSAWYEGLWDRRDRIAGKPALILWGLKDSAFKEQHLQRWKELFHRGEVLPFPETGHFVQEEEAEGLAPIILQFLTKTR